MLIKVILLFAIVVVVVLFLRAPAGARHLAVRRMAVVVVAALAVLSVIFPDAWNAAAEFVGVGRGTDLLLYGFIVVFLVSMVTTYRRFRETESRMTLLARRIAIDEALGTLEGGSAADGPAAASGPSQRSRTAGPES